MKNDFILKLYLLIYITSSTFFLHAHNTVNQNNNSDYSHRGFYLSLCFGSGYASIQNNSINQQFSIKGAPSYFNFQIGLGIEDNIVIGFNLQNIGFVMNDFVYHNTHYSLNDHYLYMMKKGVFIKTYLLPKNVFAELEVSVGRFIITNATSTSSAGTNNGFGLGLKGGKEWMFGKRKRLSFGVNATGSLLMAADLPPYEKEIWKGKAFLLGILIGYH